MNRSRSQPKIVIFTSSTCGWCEAVKRYLRKNRFRFREVDVNRDRNAAKELQRRGIRGVPVILINNRPIVGFNKEKINQLLGIRSH